MSNKSDGAINWVKLGIIASRLFPLTEDTKIEVANDFRPFMVHKKISEEYISVTYDTDILEADKDKGFMEYQFENGDWMGFNYSSKLDTLVIYPGELYAEYLEYMKRYK